MTYMCQLLNNLDTMILMSKSNIFSLGIQQLFIAKWLSKCVSFYTLNMISMSTSLTLLAIGFLLCLQAYQSGEVIHLEPGCSWKDHLVDLETEQHIENAIKFVTCHDRLTNQYVVQGVPESLGTRTTRCV